MSDAVIALLMLPAAWAYLWLCQEGRRLTASAMWLFVGGFLFGRAVGTGRIFHALTLAVVLAVFVPGLVRPAVDADRRLR